MKHQIWNMKTGKEQERERKQEKKTRKENKKRRQEKKARRTQEIPPHRRPALLTAPIPHLPQYNRKVPRHHYQNHHHPLLAFFPS
jgi:hypothetical protein